MPLVDSQPFIGIDAFNKATDRYIPFPSSSDAMLASLQLFHDVPCRIMDLVISVVTHPDFNSKLVTLNGSADVIRITEEARLGDREAVMHRRSLNAFGHMGQTKIPQFVLDCVLDVIKASRESRIKEIYGKGFSDFNTDRDTIEENGTLSNMALVHRSWTSPAQKALGQVICIREAVIKLDFLSNPGSDTIFGTWTTVAVIGLLASDGSDFGNCYHDSREHVERSHMEYRDLQHFENLYRLLLTFTNLRKLYARSYVPLLTRWSNSMVEAMIRQNPCLTELTLQAMESEDYVLHQSYNLDFLVKDYSQNLRKLSIKGGTFSKEVQGSAIQTVTFPCLCSLTMGGTPRARKNDSTTLKTFFHILSAQPNTEFNSLSFHVIDPVVLDDVENAFTPRQCANICQHLRNASICIDEKNGTRWIEWVATHCPNLKDISLHIYGAESQILPPLPATTENVDITFYSYMEMDSLLSCKSPLLTLARSSGRPTLKAVSMTVPHQAGRGCGHRSIEERNNLFDDFVDEMTAVCTESGIEFKIVEGE